jgi:hypothetical protein
MRALPSLRSKKKADKLWTSFMKVEFNAATSSGSSSGLPRCELALAFSESPPPQQEERLPLPDPEHPAKLMSR